MYCIIKTASLRHDVCFICFKAEDTINFSIPFHSVIQNKCILINQCINEIHAMVLLSGIEVLEQKQPKERWIKPWIKIFQPYFQKVTLEMFSQIMSLYIPCYSLNMRHLRLFDFFFPSGAENVSWPQSSPESSEIIWEPKRSQSMLIFLLPFINITLGEKNSNGFIHFIKVPDIQIFNSALYFPKGAAMFQFLCLPTHCQALLNIVEGF